MTAVAAVQGFQFPASDNNVLENDSYQRPYEAKTTVNDTPHAKPLAVINNYHNNKRKSFNNSNRRPSIASSYKRQSIRRPSHSSLYTLDASSSTSDWISMDPSNPINTDDDQFWDFLPSPSTTTTANSAPVLTRQITAGALSDSATTLRNSIDSRRSSSSSSSTTNAFKSKKQHSSPLQNTFMENLKTPRRKKSIVKRSNSGRKVVTNLDDQEVVIPVRGSSKPSLSVSVNSHSVAAAAPLPVLTSRKDSLVPGLTTSGVASTSPSTSTTKFGNNEVDELMWLYSGNDGSNNTIVRRGTIRLKQADSQDGGGTNNNDNNENEEEEDIIVEYLVDNDIDDFQITQVNHHHHLDLDSTTTSSNNNNKRKSISVSIVVPKSIAGRFGLNAAPAATPPPQPSTQRVLSLLKHRIVDFMSATSNSKDSTDKEFLVFEEEDDWTPIVVEPPKQQPQQPQPQQHQHQQRKQNNPKFIPPVRPPRNHSLSSLQQQQQLSPKSPVKLMRLPLRTTSLSSAAAYAA